MYASKHPQLGSCPSHAELCFVGGLPGRKRDGGKTQASESKSGLRYDTRTLKKRIFSCPG